MPIWGQVSTRSPYSIYGLGDLEPPGFTQHSAMGGATMAVRLPNTVNISNPALLSTLFRPTLEVGLSSRFLTLQSPDGSSQQSSATAIRNIVLGFPVVFDKLKSPLKRKLAFSIGLTPYSSIGYNIIDTQEDDTFGEVGYEYEGEGGVNQAFLAAGFDIWRDPDTTDQLSLGVKASFMFGPVSQTRRIVFPDGSNAFNTRVTNSTNVNDLYLDYGIYYRKLLYQHPGSKKQDSNIFISAGINFSPSTNLRASRTNFAATYTGSPELERIRDTISNETQNGEITMPMSISAGIGLEINNQWIIAADYHRQDWGEFRFFGNDENLSAVNSYHFGLQYIPDFKALANEYYKTIMYRAGFRYQDTRLQVNGETLDEYGINFGLGFPLIFSGSTSTFNIGVEFAQRGNNTNDLIREQRTSLNVGFTFTPSPKFDPWFYQRKID